MKEQVGIKTSGRIIFYDENNKVYKTEKICNLITNEGRKWIIQRMRGAVSTVIQDMEIGTGTTAPTVTDTGVTTFLATKTVSFTDDFTNRKFTCNVSLGQLDYIGENIGEIALKLNDTKCFNHSVFTPFTKATISVDIEFDIMYP